MWKQNRNLGVAYLCIRESTNGILIVMRRGLDIGNSIGIGKAGREVTINVFLCNFDDLFLRRR